MPWCKENGLELLIMDNDPKLHGKAVVTFMKENGVQIYPGSGKNPWVPKPYPYKSKMMLLFFWLLDLQGYGNSEKKCCFF